MWILCRREPQFSCCKYLSANAVKSVVPKATEVSVKVKVHKRFEVLRKAQLSVCMFKPKAVELTVNWQLIRKQWSSSLFYQQNELSLTFCGAANNRGPPEVPEAEGDIFYTDAKKDELLSVSKVIQDRKCSQEFVSEKVWWFIFEDNHQQPSCI